MPTIVSPPCRPVTATFVSSVPGLVVLNVNEAVVRRHAEQRRSRIRVQRQAAHALAAADGIDARRCATREIDRVQLGRRRRGERDGGEGGVVDAADVEADRGLHVDAQRADRLQVAVVGIAGRLALDHQAIVRDIEHVQRRRARAGEAVRVGGGSGSRAAGIQRRVRRGRARVDVDAQVLTGVAHHAQAIRHRVEVDAELARRRAP